MATILFAIFAFLILKNIEYNNINLSSSIINTGKVENQPKIAKAFEIKGVVSNNFGKNIGKDIDNDGDIDSAVIIDNTIGYSICMDKSNKIYVTGYTNSNDTTSDLIIIKINQNGIIDNSFGVNGYVTLNNIAGGNSHDIGYSINIDNHGKLYVTGISWNGNNNDLIVIRLNQNGTLDKSFGSKGYIVLNSIAGGNGHDFGQSIHIDKAGKIYVTGYSDSKIHFKDLIVIKLNYDGTLDRSFGSNGKAVFHNIAGGNLSDYGNSIHTDNTGNIYITGSSDSHGNAQDLIVIKLKPNGTLDTSFNSKGYITFNNIAGNNTIDQGNSIFVDNDGKIYVTGLSYRPGGKNGNSDLVVIKLNPNGKLDKSFGSNGFFTLHNVAGGNSFDESKSIHLDKDGKIYITGYSWNGNSKDLIAIRLTPNGNLDNSFGSKGKIVINNITGKESNEEGYSIHINSSKVHIIGSSNTLNNDNNNQITQKENLILIQIE
ncbi:MAG: SBBP repeat-containing protein [Candidatus Calescibacterium sp.]|nr:SBBP repeat-containing protein [Candidatus Calescibacterium sp.]MCX7758217.1 SBBP repeat-containing protein [bacterium]